MLSAAVVIAALRVNLLISAIVYVFFQLNKTEFLKFETGSGGGIGVSVNFNLRPLAVDPE